MVKYEDAGAMNPQFRITNGMAASLTRIERARGFLDAAQLSEEWITGMQQRALVLEAHLLSMLCLYRKGYDFKRLFTLSEYYDRDRSSYYRAIQSVRERDLDLTEWLEYFTIGLGSQLGEVWEKGESLIRLDILTSQHKLTARQRVALELAASMPEFRMEDFEVRCSVSTAGACNAICVSSSRSSSLWRREPQIVSSTAWLASPENLRQTRDTTCDKLAPVLRLEQGTVPTRLLL